VIVVAGPSGAGKSRLCTRLGLPVLNLDDYYKDGTDPTLPWVDLGGGHRIVDWDDPRSWSCQEAVDAVERLCVEGEVEVPVYDIAHDGRVGHRKLTSGGSSYFVAEGIFAQEIVRDCRARGLLAAAVCVRNPRPITFWRRLTRDLREHRKPPLVLLRRGLRLMRGEPGVVAHAVALGCTPMTSEEAYRRLSGLVEG
jgi:uridine kinase